MRKSADKSKKHNRADETLRSELERLVAEQTRQYTVVNEELRKEITERKRTEERLRRSEAFWVRDRE